MVRLPGARLEVTCDTSEGSVGETLLMRLSLGDHGHMTASRSPLPVSGNLGSSI